MVAPTLSLNAEPQSGTLRFNFNNPAAAGTSYFAEINRARDFSSDDSLVVQLPGASAGNQNGFIVDGLPSGTPWFTRVTNVGTGERSNIILVATAPVVPSTAYTGYSIDKAMLVVPEDIAGLRVTGSTGAGLIAGYPLGNLLLDSPAATTRFDIGITQFDFETAGTPIDTIALLGSLMNDAARIYVFAYSDEARTTPIYNSGWQTYRCSPTLGRRRTYHALHMLPAAVSTRYWRMAVDTSAPQAILRHLVVGLARQSINASRGWSHGMNDLGTAGLTRFGDPDIVPGWRGKTVDFEMSWLTEREYQTKWADLPQLVGKTKPVLVIPNSKRNVWLNDRIGFGTITDYRAENVQGSRHTVSVAVNSIY